MNKEKLIKRVQNLKRIKSIIEIAKFDALRKIVNSNEIKKHHYEIANISKEIITFAKNKNKLVFQNKNQIFNTLWIFITIPSKIIQISYKRLEKIIKENWNNQDQIITIGNPAFEFAQKNKYPIFASFDNLDKTAEDVAALSKQAANNNQFSTIKIVAQTSNITRKLFVLYPIDNVDIEYKKYNSLKYYFSLSKTIENISNSYIKNIIVAIYQETFRFLYQEKIFKHESSIKNIDEKLKKLQIDLHKSQRKKDTEEMINITQISKRR